MNDNESTNIDFGPLQGLIGTWKGDQGQDVAPEPDGSEENLYYETLTIEPVGDVSNAERQKLVALRYSQVVHRKSDDKLIHNQLGYWIWDAETRTVVQSLNIPRAVCLLAGGTVSPGSAPGDVTFEVAARDGDGELSSHHS